MTTSDQIPVSKPPARGTWKQIVLIAVFGGLLIVARQPVSRDFLSRVLEWVGNSGWTGFAVFVLVYVATCVLMLPGLVLSLGAGLIWGTLKGTLAVSVASTLGACAAFLVGRYFMRTWVMHKTEDNPRLRALDTAAATLGWKIVFLTRLSPVFPFSLLNYAFGLTAVSFRGYALASWIGMLPGTVMYVYLGSIGRTAVSESPTLAGWLLRIAGIVATFAVTLLAAHAARTALKNARID